MEVLARRQHAIEGYAEYDCLVAQSGKMLDRTRWTVWIKGEPHEFLTDQPKYLSKLLDLLPLGTLKYQLHAELSAYGRQLSDDCISEAFPEMLNKKASDRHYHTVKTKLDRTMSVNIDENTIQLTVELIEAGFLVKHWGELFVDTKIQEVADRLDEKGMIRKLATSQIELPEKSAELLKRIKGNV